MLYFVVCYAHLYEKLCVLSLKLEAGCHDGSFLWYTSALIDGF